MFLFEVPRSAKLAYCLVRDERVPLAPKLALGGALGLIVSPLDIPGWIPVIGDLDMLALGVLAVKVFVDACPEQVVEEHRAALQRGESLFDRDWRLLFAVARDGVGRLATRSEARLALSESRVSEDEPA
jgi:uncharacterized membrane protein YkvA (DUF1232 family)